MTDFLLFCLASVGMTAILVGGTIFEPFRNRLADGAESLRRRRKKKKLPPRFTLIEFASDVIHCPQCCGFWCGLFCGIFYVTSDMTWILQSSGNTIESTSENAIPSSFSFFSLFASSSILFLANRALMLFCCGLTGSILALSFHLSAEYISIRTMLMKQEIRPESNPLSEHVSDISSTRFDSSESQIMSMPSSIISPPNQSDFPHDLFPSDIR
ncbi:MAG: DUF1360 domain-containing protein [Thermoguttaceae bacterium]